MGRSFAFIVLTLIAPTAMGSFPGRNGRIAFVLDSPFDPDFYPNEIAAITPDGTHRRRLTQRGTYKFGPTFSPDGRRIVFAESGLSDSPIWHIVVMRADGRRLRRLTNSRDAQSDPRFSPDGRKIVFVRGGDDRGIYTISANGRHARRLTHGGEHPSYSPDGRRIVFLHASGYDWGISVMNADGSHQHKLTSAPLYPPDPVGARYFVYTDFAPSFSPDGKSIIFERDTCGGGGQIYVMTANGSHVRPLTRSDPPCGLYQAPTYSPDGRRIVVQRGRQLYLLRSDGTHRRALTKGEDEYGAPDWQPLEREDHG